jgi:hypothetical protein
MLFRTQAYEETLAIAFIPKMERDKRRYVHLASVGGDVFLHQPKVFSNQNFVEVFSRYS